MKDNFDINRFWRLLCWDVTANMRTVLGFFFGVAFGALLFFEFEMYNLSTFDYTEAQAHGRIDGLASMFFFFMTVFSFLSPSYILSPLRDKRRRSTYLSLPASMLEKFLVRYLVSTVGMVAVAVAAFALADCLRLLVCAVVGPHCYEPMFAVVADRLPWFFSADGAFSAARNAGGWVFVAALFLLPPLVHAYFLLCGVVFRRKAWLLSSGLFFVLLFFHTAVSIDFFSGVVDAASGSVAVSVLLFVAELAVLAAVYWLSYRLFCRIQIVGRKWVSL